MPRLLIKRFFRSFKENFARHFAQILLVFAVVTVIVSLERTAFTIIDGRQNNKDFERIEDGQFTTLFPIPDDEISKLCEEYNVQIQENFGVDVQSENKIYRIFRQRENIDVQVFFEGTLPDSDYQAVIEQNYAYKYNISCGDSIDIGDNTYTVCGIASLPDYVHSTEHMNDICATADRFLWVIVTDSEFEKYYCDNRYTPEYTYAYRLSSKDDLVNFSHAVYDMKIDDSHLINADESLREYISSMQNGENGSMPNVLQFIEREDNRRMDIELKYAFIYKSAGFSVGILLIAMLAFIFAVVTRNEIHNDHNVIGSLYALGVSKRTIISFYIFPGVIVSFLGGIIGLTVGFLPEITDISMRAFHGVNSFPYYELSNPLVLYLYSLVMPPIVNFAVNYIVLNRSLSHSALSLIRGTYESKKVFNIKLKTNNFIRRFKLRHLIEERGSIITFVCVLSSLIILMLGLSTNAMIKNNVSSTIENTNYKYLCTLKYPAKDLATSGEKIFIKNVKSEYGENNIIFSLVGIPENSKFYSAKPDNDTDSAVAGKALASKFNLKKGSKLTFCEGVAEKEFSVIITDIVDSNSNMELYMHIDCVREMFDCSSSFYNTVLFSDEPDIDDSLIYSKTKTEDILNNISLMKRAVTPFMWFSYISSILIFIAALYLIVSTMIDSTSIGISLIHVLGYDHFEAHRMYISPISYSVIAALIFAIPVSKIISSGLCRYVFSKFATGMFFELPIEDYVIVFLSALAIFFFILLLLLQKVKRIDTSLALKCRE
ncbi:MAG: ABC transporter permease [Clostridia bacterium]|nr:ABC transporter permease [Clostridia bacterium]